MIALFFSLYVIDFMIHVFQLNAFGYESFRKKKYFESLF